MDIQLTPFSRSLYGSHFAGKAMRSTSDQALESWETEGRRRDAKQDFALISGLDQSEQDLDPRPGHVKAYLSAQGNGWRPEQFVEAQFSGTPERGCMTLLRQMEATPMQPARTKCKMMAIQGDSLVASSALKVEDGAWALSQTYLSAADPSANRAAAWEIKQDGGYLIAPRRKEPEDTRSR